MHPADFEEVTGSCLPDNHLYSITQMETGLINHSFRLEDSVTGDSFFLQTFNLNVFPEPRLIQENYLLLSTEIRNFKIPEYCTFRNGEMLFKDSANRYWRIFRFIPDAISYEHTKDPETAAAVAETFARFTSSCTCINPSMLHTILPGFHDLNFRYNQFSNAVKSAGFARKDKATELINALLSRKKYVNFYLHMCASGQFPQRVMHHDAKISNVLFHKTDRTLICPVDFDTVMPGYFISDLGDMIRSMAGTADENETNFREIQVRPDIYKAIIDGYLLGMSGQFTAAEIENIHMAAPLLIYMQSLRFITDYLQHDRYYKITYPEQNFNRAQNQLTLLTRLEEFLNNTYNFTEIPTVQ